MKKLFFILVCCLFVSAGHVHAADHRLGAGLSYWVAIDDIDIDNIDDNGLGTLISYQYLPGLVGLEIDFEILPDRFGEAAYAPQAFLLVGQAIYAGAGAGITYTDGDFSEEPFYSLKAGVNLEMLPGIYLDIFGTYRFNDKADLKDEATDIDTDTVFLGTVVRIAL